MFLVHRSVVLAVLHCNNNTIHLTEPAVACTRCRPPEALQLATGKMGGAESTTLDKDGLQVQPPAGRQLGSQCTHPPRCEEM